MLTFFIKTHSLLLLIFFHDLMFPVGKYSIDTIRDVHSRYDVLKNLQQLSFECTKNEQHLFYSDPLLPSLEEVLEVVSSIPKKPLNTNKLRKEMKPNKLCTILKREPVAQELVLPKKATELMTILLNDDNPDEAGAYKIVLSELNIMLGKVEGDGNGISSGLMVKNRKIGNNERLNSLLEISHRAM